MDDCYFCNESIEGIRYRYITVVLKSGPASKPVHDECGLRQVAGGIGHFADHQYWCNQKGDPNGGLTERQSSMAVWELYRETNGECDQEVARRILRDRWRDCGLDVES